MQVVISTPIVFLIAALVMLRGPYVGLTVLLAMLPFGMMAAFNLPAVGGMSITSTDIILLTTFLLAVLPETAVPEVLARIFVAAMPLLNIWLLSRSCRKRRRRRS